MARVSVISLLENPSVVLCKLRRVRVESKRYGYAEELL